MRTAAVIGAGASGMLAALTAAERGWRVLLFERQARVGRKLMATGNGRCNITNTGASPANYHGADGTFVRHALEAFPPEKTMEYFRSLGLFTVTEYGGRVYPLSNSANSVVDALRFALDAAGVEVRSAALVRGVARSGGGFTVTTDAVSARADAVIIACGGMAGEKLGGVKDGYELLKSLGHSRTALYPSLVQITTDSAYPRALKGIRADARLTLGYAGRQACSEGEILFTETGVSGPAAFELSRTVSASGAGGMTLRIDLLRGVDRADVFDALSVRRARMPELAASDALTGIVHNRLGKMLIKYAGIGGERPLSSLTDAELRAAADACAGFVLPVRGTESFGNAQVTAGGVKTSEFDPRTLESRLVKGLFACGEVLDVDGDCGGYNLQWAWSSGRLAGRLGE